MTTNEIADIQMVCKQTIRTSRTQTDHECYNPVIENFVPRRLWLNNLAHDQKFRSHSHQCTPTANRKALHIKSPTNTTPNKSLVPIISNVYQKNDHTIQENRICRDHTINLIKHCWVKKSNKQISIVKLQLYSPQFLLHGI